MTCKDILSSLQVVLSGVLYSNYAQSNDIMLLARKTSNNISWCPVLAYITEILRRIEHELRITRKSTRGAIVVMLDSLRDRLIARTLSMEDYEDLVKYFLDDIYGDTSKFEEFDCDVVLNVFKRYPSLMSSNYMNLPFTKKLFSKFISCFSSKNRLLVISPRILIRKLTDMGVDIPKKTAEAIVEVMKQLGGQGIIYNWTLINNTFTGAIASGNVDEIKSDLKSTLLEFLGSDVFISIASQLLGVLFEKLLERILHERET